MNDGGRATGSGSSRVRLSSAERVVFPEDGLTKRDLFDLFVDGCQFIPLAA